MAGPMFRAEIERETFLGSHSEYSIKVGGVLLKALDAQDRKVGATCFVHIDPNRVICLPEAVEGPSRAAARAGVGHSE